MKGRPIIKLKLTRVDKIVEILGWLLLFAIWALTISNYQNLPDIIPTHFNASGIADGFGSKSMILTLPIVATFLFVGLTILNRFPNIFNYPVEINADNAFVQYSNATRLMRYLKLVIVFIFGLISYQIIYHAKGQMGGMEIWFLPLTLGLIFIPIIYFIIKSYRSNPSTGRGKSSS